MSQEEKDLLRITRMTFCTRCDCGGTNLAIQTNEVLDLYTNIAISLRSGAGKVIDVELPNPMKCQLGGIQSMSFSPPKT